MTTQEELDLLKQIDDATTAIGANVDTVVTSTGNIATTANTISTEIDALLANNAVPPAVATQLSAIGTRIASLGTSAATASSTLAAQVPVLEAIATKGAGTPVPVPVPEPPVVPPVV